MNVRVNLLSCGTYNTGKSVSWDKSTESVNKQFTLDAHKLYLHICEMYHSLFVRWMLGNVNQVSTVLQGNCNAGVSTSDEKAFLAYGVSGSMSRVLRNCFPFLSLRRMDMLLNTTPTVIGLSPRQKVRLFVPEICRYVRRNAIPGCLW